MVCAKPCPTCVKRNEMEQYKDELIIGTFNPRFPETKGNNPVCERCVFVCVQHDVLIVTIIILFNA